jgi:hypothetical protein
MKKILVYITSIFIAITAISCTSECYVSKESRLGISFLDSTTFKAKNISGLTVKGAFNDSILYNNATVSAIYLPLRSNQTATNYNLILPTRVEGKTTPDTIILHIEHLPTPQLVNEECGCTMFHTINDIKLINNTYKFKLDIINSHVTNDKTYNDKETQVKILH